MVSKHEFQLALLKFLHHPRLPFCRSHHYVHLRLHVRIQRQHQQSPTTAMAAGASLNTASGTCIATAVDASKARKSVLRHLLHL